MPRSVDNRLIAKLSSGDGADGIGTDNFVGGRLVVLQRRRALGFLAEGVESFFHKTTPGFVDVGTFLFAAAKVRYLDQDLVLLVGGVLNHRFPYAYGLQRVADVICRRLLAKLHGRNGAALKIDAQVERIRSTLGELAADR
jgi:hypothetical protein